MKQVPVIVGTEYLWHPTPMVGKDGHTYNVFTTFASGRGWGSNQYIIREDNSDKPIRVRMLPEAQYDGLKNGYYVELLDSMDEVIRIFKKSPYVRKSDGTFSVTSDAGFEYEGAPRGNTFGDHYSVFKVRPLFWLKSHDGGESIMREFYSGLIEAGYIKDQAVGQHITTIVTKPEYLQAV